MVRTMLGFPLMAKREPSSSQTQFKAVRPETASTTAEIEFELLQRELAITTAVLDSAREVKRNAEEKLNDDMN